MTIKWIKGHAIVPHLNTMDSFVINASGINSTLLMEHQVGGPDGNDPNWIDPIYKNMKDYSFHPRYEQPCQGGEMRKYRETHGDECTKPESRRPTDLVHPFPKGKPVAIGVKFSDVSFNKDREDLLKFLFSSKSPWRRGTGKSGLVWVDDEIIGAVVTDTGNVDPTVMVNLFQFINDRLDRSLEAIDVFMEKGASMSEALALVVSSGDPTLRTFTPTFEYYYPVKMSVARFIDGDSHDLTGGSFYDRYDYDRNNVQDIFMEKDPNKAMIFERDFGKFRHGYTFTRPFHHDAEEMIEIVRSKYQEQKAQEPEEIKEAA